ncbi:NIPSNAP family protein [Maribacter litopenaei]|uniref:NIPSNAP family protein n=1 Tax=Maribacter litopenaei TaxID=2976127 RepID=A0ABY5Y9J5_9FLAO|nr:NIPSNAP family protein [Maribacter litopenaei]UWX55691.1 NIPSNAP family protein [Maribacter litopenaei]
MKNKISSLAISIILLFITIGKGMAQESKREFYELKTYTIKNEAQEKIVDNYLKNAFLPALKRMGINNIGVFKIQPGKFVMADKIFVLIPFSSLDKFEKMEASLAVDKSHLSAGEEYITAKHNNPPYERISSTLMRSFTKMPKMKPSPLSSAREDRVYELRSYESPTEAFYVNKVSMFNEGEEVELFESLNANAVFYGEVLSGDRMPNLMYMTTYENMEKRDALWKAFGASEKWQELISEEKYKNNVNKADIWLLYPTEYSDY